MRTLFLEVARTTGDHPANDDRYQSLSTELLKSVIRRFEQFEFDEVVLAGDDLFYRDDIFDIVDYATGLPMTREVLVFTNGQFHTQETGREFYSRPNVTPVVPVDFHHPAEKIVYGQDDLNEQFQRAAQRTPDVQVWQSIGNEPPASFQQVVNMSLELGLDWRGYLTTDEPPEGIVEQLQQNDLQIAPPENWWFVHQDGSVPEIPAYQQDVIQGRAESSGTIYVDVDGRATSLHTDERVPVHRLRREDLVQFSID
jgi:hypothetical protein